MATTYTKIPDGGLGALQPGDQLLYGSDLTFQNPEIQKLFAQGAAEPYYNPNSGTIAGAKMKTTYKLPTTSFTSTGQLYNSDNSGGILNNTGTYGNLAYQNIGNGMQFQSYTPFAVNAQGMTAQQMSDYADTILRNYTRQQQQQQQAANDYNKYPRTDAYGNQISDNPEIAKLQELYRTQQEALDQQYLNATAQISQQYSSLRQNVRDVGSRNMGVLNRILGRAGGFTTTAGGTALVAKQGEIDNQINTLNASQQEALGAAKLAHLQNKSAMAQSASNNLAEIDKKIKEAQQKSAENLIKLVEAMKKAPELTEGEKMVLEIEKQQKLKELGLGDYYSKPTEQKFTTKEVTVGSGKTSKTYLITYDSSGKETKRELLGGGSGSGGGDSNWSDTGNYPKGFWDAAKSSIALLQKGEPWGTVWNTMKMRFPTVSDADIDKVLGGSGSAGTGWAKEGAFEEWKQKQYKQGSVPQWQSQSGVWQWLSTPEAQSMSIEQKKNEIMSNGFNPEDFGVI